MPFGNTDDPQILARLADYRTRFASTLTGVWRTARGSADILMSSSWDFRSDGTLLVTSESVLAGLDQEVYRWEQEGPFHVRLGFPPDDETPDGTWASVRYEFVVLEHDVGKEVVLRAVGTAGFWLSDAPLARDGRSALDRSAPPRF